MGRSPERENDTRRAFAMTSNQRLATGIVRSIAAGLIATLVGTGLLADASSAADSRTKSKSKSAAGKFNPDDASVEMFEGMKNGDIEVKFIPKDSSQANVLITNKSDKPLNVKLPEAFAAVPVLAQLGRGGGVGGGAGGGGMMGGGMNQGMGGGMGGGGMMGGGMGGGMGMMNIPAEKVARFKVTCVCLEHGKVEPRAAVPYRVIPIEEFTKSPGVRELCALLGAGKIKQRVAQASAWNLNNGMGWDVLAAKRIEYIGGASDAYFNVEELREAMSVSNEATVMAEQQRRATPEKSPGETAVSAGGFREESAASPAAGSVATDQPAPRRKATSR
jgi:hypothetical protein